MGSPSSLIATWFKHADQTHIVVTFVRENGEDGALILVDTTKKTMNIVSPVANLSYGSRIRNLYSAFNSNKNRSVVVIREDFTYNAYRSDIYVNDALNRSSDAEDSKWRVSWVPFTGLVKFPDTQYTLDPRLLVDTKYVLHPSLAGVAQRVPQDIQYALEPTDSIETELLNIGKVDNAGDLTVQSSTMYRAGFNIVQSLLWLQRKFPVAVTFACPDGMFFSGTICKPCPVGTYNSYESSKEEPELAFRCKVCPPNESTLGLGATSKDRSMCL